MELKDLIIQLAQQPGPSGFETRASRTAAELLAPLVDEVRTDVMGNVIGVRRARRDNAPVVMLDAHMDEVGLIVTGYEKGALRFHPLGGVDPRILPALEVALHTKEGELHGVIDVLPPHVVPLADREKPLAIDKRGLRQRGGSEKTRPSGHPRHIYYPLLCHGGEFPVRKVPG